MNMSFGCYIRSPHTRLGYRSSWGLNICILLVIYQVSPFKAFNPPVNLSVSNVTATTAVLTWESGDVTDDVTDAYFITCKDLAYVQRYVSHTERIQIINLRPQVLYNVTVEKNTTAGEIATSEMLLFRTTLENTPPLNVSATRLTATTAKVEWNKPLTNMTIMGYVVFYAPLSAFGDPIDSLSRHSVSARTVTISGLSSSAKYFFMVSAYSADERGPFSDEVFASYLADEQDAQKVPRVVPDSPRSIRLKAVNSTAILAKWKPPKDLPKNIEGYHVYYREVLKDGERLNESEVYSNGTEVVINGLKTGTTYDITVSVWDGVGDGIYSRPKLVTTEEEFTKFQREELRLLQQNADTNERIAALLLQTYEAVVQISTLLDQRLNG